MRLDEIAAVTQHPLVTGAVDGHERAVATMLAFMQISEQQNARQMAMPGTPYSGIGDFIVREGRFWAPAALPADVDRGMKRECFKNALDLAAERDDLIYVEGYAFKFIPTLHAWCVDADGNVVDPTWDQPEASVYYGVAFARDYALEVALERGYYGLIDNPEMRWPLITGKHAHWRVPDAPAIRPR